MAASIARIADAADGAVRHDADDVAIPLRMVVLFWLRAGAVFEGETTTRPPASKSGNNQKANRLVTQGALEGAGEIIVHWWDWCVCVERRCCQSALLHGGAQTLPLPNLRRFRRQWMPS